MIIIILIIIAWLCGLTAFIYIIPGLCDYDGFTCLYKTYHFKYDFLNTDWPYFKNNNFACIATLMFGPLNFVIYPIWHKYKSIQWEMDAMMRELKS